jgi:hypothetical protein
LHHAEPRAQLSKAYNGVAREQGEFAVRLKLEAVRRLTAGLTDHRWPAVAPDGQWVAHVVEAGDGADIYLTDLDGRFGRAIAGPGEGRRDPFFLEAGLLGLSEQVGGRFRIDSVDVRKGTRRTILDHPSASLRGAALVQQRGRLIASGDLTREQKGPSLLQVDLAGSTVEKVTEQAGPVERNPSVSKDGARVAFEAYANKNASECALMLFDGKRRRTEPLAFEPGTRYARPCFVDEGTVLLARETAKGRRELVVCELKTKRISPLGLDIPATDPTVFAWPAGGIGVAFAGQQGIPGADQRPGAPWDIFVARLAAS